MGATTGDLWTGLAGALESDLAARTAHERGRGAEEAHNQNFTLENGERSIMQIFAAHLQNGPPPACNLPRCALCTWWVRGHAQIWFLLPLPFCRGIFITKGHPAQPAVCLERGMST